MERKESDRRRKNIFFSLLGKEITVIVLGSKMFLKVGTHRIVRENSSMLGWLWRRVTEVKGGTVCASSVLNTEEVSEALSWVRPLLHKSKGLSGPTRVWSLGHGGHKLSPFNLHILFISLSMCFKAQN